MSTPAHVDTGDFRRVLGEFCTGVTIITTMTDGHPVGFACQSFSALSLDPPLVLFCPSVHSRAWAAIEASGVFCVNILAHEQRSVSQIFGRPGTDKFSDVAWSAAPSGSPVLEGAAAWVDCTVDRVLPGGDHHIVIGAVNHLTGTGTARPLLFHRGDYTATERLRLVSDEDPLSLPMTADAWF